MNYVHFLRRHRLFLTWLCKKGNKAKTNKGRRRNDAHEADQAVKISPWQELLEGKITQTKKQNRNFSYTPKAAQMRSLHHHPMNCIAYKSCS